MQPVRSQGNLPRFSYAAVTQGVNNITPLNKVVAPASRFKTPYVSRINNVHQDDIHALISHNGEFISGSKDGTVKIWSSNFECENEIAVLKADGKIDYRYWVTSLIKLSDDKWCVGSRNGIFRIFDENHELISQTTVSVDSAHNSKKRNADRIACLTELVDFDSPASKLILGLPRELQVVDVKTLNLKYKTTVSNNDWVYTVQHLNASNYLVVIGSVLEIWKNNTQGANLGFSKIARLHEEIKSEVNGKQRPFISAIESLSLTHLCMVDFSGRIKIMDVENNSLISNIKGHENRAWSVKKITDQTFATSADDATVKIWDLRQSSQVAVFKEHPGRVSVLLMKNNTQIIAGSCPDDVFKQEEKASFTIWDTRVN